MRNPWRRRPGRWGAPPVGRWRRPGIALAAATVTVAMMMGAFGSAFGWFSGPDNGTAGTPAIPMTTVTEGAPRPSPVPPTVEMGGPLGPPAVSEPPPPVSASPPPQSRRIVVAKRQSLSGILRQARVSPAEIDGVLAALRTVGAAGRLTSGDTVEMLLRESGEGMEMLELRLSDGPRPRATVVRDKDGFSARAERRAASPKAPLPKAAARTGVTRTCPEPPPPGNGCGPGPVQGCRSGTRECRPG